MREDRRFYVYVHKRADTGEPFYYGKGCGKRAWDLSSSGRATSNMLNSSRYICEQCGMISNPGAIGKHQKTTGHRGKEKL